MNLSSTSSHLSADSRWQAGRDAVTRAPRAILLALVVLVVFGGFTYRLHFLQFVKGEEYEEQAERQSIQSVEIPALRGIVYDAAGTPLVSNVPSYRVTLVPADLPDDEQEAEEVLIRLACILDMPYTTAGREGPDELGLLERVSPHWGSYRPVDIKKGVDRDTALIVDQERFSLPGVSVRLDSRREYPFGPLLSQVLGYLQPIPAEQKEEYEEEGYDSSIDRVGAVGIEAFYEDLLRGTKGRQLVEKDVLGRVVRVVEQESVPVPGGNVHLTIDLELQEFVEEALRYGMETVQSPRGVAIVMDPNTGEIGSLVSLPTYDNNLFARGISSREYEELHSNEHLPLYNHAIGDRLPPGSVFKVVMSAAALQEGVVTKDTTFNCGGTMVVPNKYAPNDPGLARPFYCWNRSGHGSLNIIGGIAHSCDIYFYKVGGGFEETEFEGLGVTRIAEYSRMFGLGSPTGVELPSEIAGTVPDATWKRLKTGESWSTGDTYNLSIGQGYLEVTPLQMLNAVNVVANRGTLYRPRLVHHTTDAEGNVMDPFEPDVVNELPIDDDVWTLVHEGMEAAVVYGSAQRAQVEGVRVAGKTGTAQFCDNLMCGVGYEQPEHAWFAAFAPVEAPEVSVIVFIYNGGEGSQVAAPVAQEILEYYFRDDVESPE